MFENNVSPMIYAFKQLNQLHWLGFRWKKLEFKYFYHVDAWTKGCLLIVEEQRQMGTQRVQMKGVLTWLVHLALHAGTRDFCSAWLL
jgi:hypothetical protein